jgi:hypothetical protein
MGVTTHYRGMLDDPGREDDHFVEITEMIEIGKCGERN